MTCGGGSVVTVNEKENEWHASRVSLLVSSLLARRSSRKSLCTSPSPSSRSTSDVSEASDEEEETEEEEIGEEDDECECEECADDLRELLRELIETADPEWSSTQSVQELDLAPQARYMANARGTAPCPMRTACTVVLS